MNSDPIIVFGASGHSRVVIDILESQGHRILGLVDSFKPSGTKNSEYEVLGDEYSFKESCYAIDGIRSGVIAIGDNFCRSQLAQRVLALMPDFTFITAVHPAAHIAKYVSIGAGTVVMAGAVVNPGSKLGEHCIINTKASVDHDGCLQDFASIGPGATLGGNVTIRPFGAVGLGANVIHNITIGEHSILGAGATLLKDLPDFSVAWGVPARVTRTRVAGERYL